MRIIAIVLAITLGGCMTFRYVNPEGKEASAREVQECEYEATKATASRGAWDGGLGAVALANNRFNDKQSVMAACMRLKGNYKPAL